MVRYDQNMKGYSQNRSFRLDQWKFYSEINGKCTDVKLIVADNKRGQRFGSDVWEKDKVHEKALELLQEIK